jgi:hypothetical protein
MFLTGLLTFLGLKDPAVAGDYRSECPEAFQNGVELLSAAQKRLASRIARLNQDEIDKMTRQQAEREDSHPVFIDKEALLRTVRSIELLPDRLTSYTDGYSAFMFGENQSLTARTGCPGSSAGLKLDIFKTIPPSQDERFTADGLLIARHEVTLAALESFFAKYANQEHSQETLKGIELEILSNAFDAFGIWDATKFAEKFLEE